MLEGSWKVRLVLFGNWAPFVASRMDRAMGIAKFWRAVMVGSRKPMPPWLAGWKRMAWEVVERGGVVPVSRAVNAMAVSRIVFAKGESQEKGVPDVSGDACV